MTTAALLAGIGGLLTTAGVVVYDPARTWTDADTQIPLFEGDLPPSPSSVVAMLPYTIRDDPKLTDSTIAVQFKIRGTTDPLSVLAVNDGLFDALHGIHDVTVNGVPVVLAWRHSAIPGSRDKNDRYLFNTSFYFQITLPSLHRED